MKKVFVIVILAICYLTCFSQENGTFKDTRDEKVYKIIKIGNQTWFAENLVYKANSGCWAYDNNESNVSKYGYLYDWETAKSICPSGWHLPSDVEWTALTDNLGGENVAGGKMKTTTDWKYEANVNATNESGFSALPAGFRFTDGTFDAIGKDAYFWSSTQGNCETSWRRNLYYPYSKVSRNNDVRKAGYSIRCLKD